MSLHSCTRFRASCPVLGLIVLVVIAPGSVAQVPATPSAAGRWEISGIPALNYDADEKFGYGAIVQLYRYGGDTLLPYRLTIQPTIFLTTGGRRDFTIFMDAPDLRGSGVRMDVFAGHETQKAYPYYGIGNDAQHDPALEAEPNERFYRFGRRRLQVAANAQRRVHAVMPLRVLAGAGMAHSDIDPLAGGAGTTLLVQEWDNREGWSNYLRAGVVWDTRDREVHTRRGTWADLLVQRVDRAFGSNWSYTRSTATVRHYVPVMTTLTLAQRLLVQEIAGDPPFYDLGLVQTSFKAQEGLGGSQTLRGIPKGRFIGKGLAFSNTELRWRAAEPTLLGLPGSVTLSGFVDAGRVWADGVDLGSIASDLHVGYGGGARLGRGPNFVVALDVGRSVESAASIYIGLGYLY